MKNNKGITLIALIITIIVMLILAAVSINMVIGEDGIIKKSEEAGEKIEREAKIEQIIIDKGMELNASELRSSQKMLRNLAEICIDNNVNPDLLTVYYDKRNKQEYIVYKPIIYTADYYEDDEKKEEINRRIEEEDRIAQIDNVYMLMGDVDGNGYFNQEDINIIEEYFTDSTKTEIGKNYFRVEIVNFDKDPRKRITASDLNILEAIIEGSSSMY